MRFFKDVKICQLSFAVEKIILYLFNNIMSVASDSVPPLTLHYKGFVAYVKNKDAYIYHYHMLSEQSKKSEAA